MPVKPSYYETLLADYSNRDAAIALLKQHRPYLEMIPSMRRPYESVITLPLPVARIRHPKPNNSTPHTPNTTHLLPCDLAILMCDPEWKIKMGVEILVFIHRPQEDFSDLLMRWRNTQVYLDKDYEWIMPHRYEHVLSEGSEKVYPLFVVFSETPERIQRGLAGASLPYIIHHPPELTEAEAEAEQAWRENHLGIED
ncbi:hypothetical protein VB712_13685 [Spirulina sp. CCNP1310]|uniref:hypothetical protein n=1 Tax=Spirulina sp. CCNP1310 TaxID=3110249 RepID=UPI002B1F303F|nr:hypothetical protein [Spirulina sp. CCNP1310]MEA5420277.1 hypothetical protein [Spirulina sp. CCNP1310]